jgi:hypothetical protein
MLPYGISESNLLHRCKQGGSFSSFIGKFTRSATLQSTAGVRYTPSNVAAAPSNVAQGLQSAGVAVSLNNSPKPAQTTNQLASSGAQAAGVQQAVLDDPRILFGVRGPHPALKLEQISVDNTMNDSNFYDELKKYYRLNRGRLRYWFSFWRLGYCEVVKVSNTPQ